MKMFYNFLPTLMHEGIESEKEFRLVVYTLKDEYLLKIN